MKSASPESPRTAVPLGPDTIAKNVALLVGLTLFQRIVGFIRGIFFCGSLEPQQLGEWDMAYGFFLMVAPIAVLGLPGSFGRYLEHYRQQGQLRAVVRRTSKICGIMAIAAIAAVGLLGPWLSQWVFGRLDRSDLVLLMGVVLFTVIAYNFLTELLTALRFFRMVSVMQFLNSVTFAVLGVALLIGWKKSVAAVVLAFGGASVLGSVVGLIWLRHVWRAMPDDAHSLPHRELWAKLLPYAAWMWIGNLLYNLFEVADRYMLLHCSQYNADDALVAVGNYHSSRIVPLLLLTIATMLGGMITPYLSHDWEAGRRGAVSHRLNFTLKVLGLGQFAACVAILLVAPFLFGVVLHGKYSGGLAVLPWTLAYCSWLGYAVVAQNYLFCVERARLGSVAFLVGLLCNIGLNFVLVPQFGLVGAVWATAVAKILAMSMILFFSCKLGFVADRSVWWIAFLPLSLGLGVWFALGALFLAVAFAALGEGIFNAEQKRELREHCARALEKVIPRKMRNPVGT